MNTLAALLLLASAAKDPMRYDFEEAAISKLPPGWTAAKTGEGDGSIWKVVEDATSPKGKKVLAQVSDKGPGPLFNLCVADKSKFGDIDFSIAFKAVGGKKDQGGGPM